MAEVAGSNPASPTKIPSETSSGARHAALGGTRDPHVLTVYTAVAPLGRSPPGTHQRNPQERICPSWSRSAFRPPRALLGALMYPLRTLRSLRAAWPGTDPGRDAAAHACRKLSDGNLPLATAGRLRPVGILAHAAVLRAGGRAAGVRFDTRAGAWRGVAGYNTASNEFAAELRSAHA